VKSARLTALIVSAAIFLALPALALAAGHPTAAPAVNTGTSTSTTSQLTSTAPARLTNHPGHKSSATLPNTGLNLLPETIAGVLLLGAGIGLRARRPHGLTYSRR
jgi:hypothetical protein